MLFSELSMALNIDKNDTWERINNNISLGNMYNDSRTDLNTFNKKYWSSWQIFKWNYGWNASLDCIKVTLPSSRPSWTLLLLLIFSLCVEILFIPPHDNAFPRESTGEATHSEAIALVRRGYYLAVSYELSTMQIYWQNGSSNRSQNNPSTTTTTTTIWICAPLSVSRSSSSIYRTDHSSSPRMSHWMEVSMRHALRYRVRDGNWTPPGT